MRNRATRQKKKMDKAIASVGETTFALSTTSLEI